MDTKIYRILILFIFSASSFFAQSEILTNNQIIEMSKVGLDKQVIMKKINETANNFDVSVNALIELKKAGVADEVIALMMEKTRGKTFSSGENQTSSENNSNNSSDKTDVQGYSDNVPANFPEQIPQKPLTPKEALLTAKTIAIEKSSLHPSRQALEKELLKRKELQQLNLSIVRYKESADLYIEIGRVPLSLISHRYVFRIYDRRSGTIITAGETTSWGSLAKNLAQEIGKKLSAILN
jgi:hypothetical protein